MANIKTVNEESLVALGDAIRSKTGGEEPLEFPTGMVEAIEGIEAAVPAEPVELTGTCDYACAGAMASQYIDMYGNTISTKNITNASHMFYNYSGETIPFDINISGSSCEMSYMFSECVNLQALPKINFTSTTSSPYNFNYMFYHCEDLREIPDDYFDEWNLSKVASSTSSYSYNASYLFAHCYSLRSVPLHWLQNMNPKHEYYYTFLSNGFQWCYSLDELVGLPFPTGATWTSNAFSSTFAYCGRLKNIIFETNEDGTPKTVRWKSQTLDLSNGVGYLGILESNFLSNNSGITADKKVYDDATYQALKNDPDWYTTNMDNSGNENLAYSRYNHDSAVATINSLPDTSAYLASAGGTNTIKFKGAAGSKTDGGAINTLTEAEIAVAVAKGWTVSLV